jgi:hypothetical protein
MTTKIIDGSGVRYVEIPQSKRRKPARALRFAGLKVGEQLVQRTEISQTVRDVGADNDSYKQVPWRAGDAFFLVTDLWFDPVAGQTDPVKGQMVGLVQIKAGGDLWSHKSSTTLRGLASQRYHYYKGDRIAECKLRLAAVKAGDVVGIGYGKTIRKRPRLPGDRF